MSIVPLKLGESIVARQDAFKVQGNAMLVLNLEASQLSGESSNVSYDLRVGSEYRGHRKAEKVELPDDGKLVLPPGDAVLVQTEESLYLPDKFFGYVVPKVTLLQRGVSNTLSKVDPGYNGPLIVTLFNLGKTDVCLKRKQPFCSLVLHTVLPGATLYNKPGKRITGIPPKGPWRPRAKEWIEANHTWLTILLSAVAVIISILRW
jgi:dCTP deaminase